MGYRVNNVPYLLKPFFWIYGYGLGLLLYLAARIFRLACPIRIEGEKNLKGLRNAIFVYWHHNNLPSFISSFYRRRNIVAFNHPGWYMKPVHLVLTLLGVKKLVMGAAGTDGRKAADEVVEYLKQGFSTFINPDGPAGPPLVLKKGALHMAAQSGAPIVPVRFLTPRQILLKKTWDGKRIPAPFSPIIIEFGTPISVTYESFDEALGKLQDALSITT